MQNRFFSILLATTLILTLAEGSYSQAQTVINPEILSFKFEKSINSLLPENIVCNIYGDSLIIGITPEANSRLNLIPTFTLGEGDTATIDDVVQESVISAHDFSEEVQYWITSSSQGVRKYTVKLISTGLPTVFIDTEFNAPIVSKDDYLKGTLRIYSNSTTPVYNGSMDIKGRGNSTWGMPKKPFKIKLNSKSSILGMPSDKEWALLANYSDKTLLRNKVAFEVSNRFEMDYTPRSQAVDVIVNGEYLGNYLLTEQVKISKDRVNIKELDGTDTEEPKVTGGYLLEIDARLDEAFWFITATGVPFTIKEPDVNEQQLEYIKQYIQTTENVLYSASFSDPVEGYAKYLDVDSFINWYWINELFKNNDAIFFSSVYIYKDRGSKLKLGPVWDFDIGAGNVNYNDNDISSGWWIRNAPWIKRLFEDPAFKQKVEQRWNELKENKIESLFSYINNQSILLETSQQQNFNKWPILDQNVWPNAVVTGSYEGEIAYLKDWLRKRIDWIDYQINKTPLTSFHLNNPVDKFLLTDETEIAFSWSPSTPGVSYLLMLDTLNRDFSQPLLSYKARNETDTLSRVDITQIKGLFDMLSAKKIDTLEIKWKVVACGLIDSVSSDETFKIITIRKKQLTPFELISLSQETINVDSLPIAFQWTSSRDAEKYQLIIDLPEGDFNNPLLVRDVENEEVTKLFIESKTFDSLLRKMNVQAGGSITLKWTVYSFLQNDSLSANAPSLVALRRKNLAQFDVIPMQETPITVSQTTTPIKFEWSASESADKYNLVLDVPDGDFTKPLLSIAGAATDISISSTQLDSLLATLNVNKGGSITLKWTVYSYSNPDSIQAIHVESITLIRNRDLTNFNLLSPADDVALNLRVSESIFFSWEQSASASYYKWFLYDASQNVIKESISDGDGTSTSYTYIYEYLKDDLLYSADGIFNWQAKAFTVDDSLLSVQNFKVKLKTEEITTGIEESLKEIRIYPNPSTGVVSFSGLEEDVSVSIMDIKGRLLENHILKKDSNQLDLTSFQKGMYIIFLRNSGGSYYRKVVLR